MITLLPSARQTLVVALPWEETLSRLAGATRPSARSVKETDNPEAPFTGWVKANEFSVSISLQRPNSFVPLLTGKIERTTAGCIVFMRYRLFPTTQVYLVFWTVFSISIGTGIGHFTQHYSYLLFGLGSALLILWVSWANFKIQQRKTSEALTRLLS
ncbi:MAG: hypothetical protein HC859_03500 [Bacteroidia bacterium]|nr:hypothetical protein [Bacteroidia bacterium]